MVSCDGEKLFTCNNVNAKRIFWNQSGRNWKKPVAQNKIAAAATL